MFDYRAGQCASQTAAHARMASTRKMRSGRAANALRSNSAARFSCAASNGCYASLAQRAAVWLAHWPLPEDSLCLFRYALFWVIGPKIYDIARVGIPAPIVVQNALQDGCGLFILNNHFNLRSWRHICIVFIACEAAVLYIGRKCRGVSCVL